MPLDLRSLLGGLSSIGGAALSADAAGNARQDLTKLLPRLDVKLPGSTVTGAGGYGATVQPGGTGGSYNLGDLESTRALLNLFGNGALGGAQQGQNMLQQIMQPAVRSQFDNANASLNGAYANGFQRPLQNTAFTGAASQLQAAGGDFSGARDQTLSLLRQQAQPFEQRNWQQLQQDQFATGRMGTTGGGIQTEAFARGLGQADLDRQLASSGEARAQQTQALNMGTGLAGVGTGLASLEDNLLNSAFGRFGQTMGLASDLTSTQLNQGLSAVNGQQSLQSQGLAQLQAALGMGQAGANTEIASGANMAALMGSASQMATSQDMWANILSGLGSRLDTGTGTGNGLLDSLLGGKDGSGGGILDQLGSLLGLGNGPGTKLGQVGTDGLASLVGSGGALSELPASLGGAAGAVAGVGTGLGEVGGAGLASLVGPGGTLSELPASLGGLAAAGVGAGLGEVGAAGLASLVGPGGALTALPASLGGTAAAAGSAGGAAAAAPAATSGLSGFMSTAGPLMVLASNLYGAYKQSQKGPAFMSGEFDPASGQVKVGFGGEYGQLIQELGVDPNALLAKIDPYLKKYAATAGTKEDKKALMASIPKPSYYTDVMTAGGRKLTPTGIAKNVKKLGVDPTEFLLYELIGGHNGLSTGKSDILGALDKQRAARSGG